MFFIIITLVDSDLKHYHKELKWNIASPDHLLKISVTLRVGRYRHDFLAFKGIDPEMIGQKAYRKDNPADKEESDHQESNTK